MFHVLLRRLTPRHPPYALSSFLLPDAERFCFHFVFLAQATATRQLRRPDVSSRFFLLFAMRLVMCSEGREAFAHHDPHGLVADACSRFSSGPRVEGQTLLFVTCSAGLLSAGAKQPGTSPGCMAPDCSAAPFAICRKPLPQFGTPVTSQAAGQSFLSGEYAAQVEMRGLEPLTSALQRRRSPN